MNILILFAIRFVTLCGATKNIIALGQHIPHESYDMATFQKGKPSDRMSNLFFPFLQAQTKDSTASLQKVLPLMPAGEFFGSFQQLWFTKNCPDSVL